MFDCKSNGCHLRVKMVCTFFSCSNFKEGWKLWAIALLSLVYRTQFIYLINFVKDNRVTSLAVCNVYMYNNCLPHHMFLTMDNHTIGMKQIMQLFLTSRCPTWGIPIAVTK